MVMQHNLLHRPVKAILGLLYPQQCVNCEDSVAVDANSTPGATLCGSCWREMQFISGQVCGRCGSPLPGDYDDGSQCDDCLVIARPWSAGRAAVVYAGAGRELVLKFKHGDRPDLGVALGGWLADAAAPLLHPGLIVAPVPLHVRRLLRRKYNQAGLLSADLARRKGLLHIPDLLRRNRHTASQDHRNISDRFANISDAINLNQSHADVVKGREVLLVDDVMTSGATLANAAEALLARGAGPVSVAVLARVVKHD